MLTSSYRTATNDDRSSARRRVTAFVMAIAIEALLLLAILALNSRSPERHVSQGGLATFDVSGGPRPASVESVQKSEPTRKVDPSSRPPAIPTVPPQPEKPLPMLIVSKEVYAASDIAKLGRPKAATANGRPHAGAAMPGDTPTVGTAPNGEPLYAAEWYREPTNRELAFYLPKRMPEGGGWGMVACRTAARFKVEDCVELASGPQGSGLGRAVRDASWQFLVRPPRVGGRVLVGEWVRIRIDYIRDEDSRR